MSHTSSPRDRDPGYLDGFDLNTTRREARSNARLAGWVVFLLAAATLLLLGLRHQPWPLSGGPAWAALAAGAVAATALGVLMFGADRYAAWVASRHETDRA